MRAVIQRVQSASVSIDGKTTAEIGPGVVLLLGVEPADDHEDIDWLSKKIVNLRLFPGTDPESEPWARSLIETRREVLLVSQFTLFASTKKGTRASWHRAAPPNIAEPLCHAMAQKLTDDLGYPVRTGKFGAMMQVALVNDGPVTLLIDTKLRE